MASAAAAATVTSFLEFPSLSERDHVDVHRVGVSLRSTIRGISLSLHGGAGFTMCALTRLKILTAKETEGKQFSFT